MLPIPLRQEKAAAFSESPSLDHKGAGLLLHYDVISYGFAGRWEEAMDSSRRALLIGGASLVAGGGIAYSLFGRQYPSDDAHGTPGHELRHIAMGHLVALDMAPLFLAKSMDLFGRHGLSVATHFFPNPGDNNAALIGGSLQLTINPFTLAYLARAANAEVQILASCGGSGVMEIVAQKESGIRSLDELADAARQGRKLKVCVLQGDTLDVVVYRALRQRGVDYRQLDIVFSNDLIAMVQTFKTKQVDILSHIKPYTTELLQDYGAVSLGTNADVWGAGTPNCVLLGMQRYVDHNPDVVRDYFAAVIEAYDFAVNNPDKAAQQLTRDRYFQVSESALRQALSELPKTFMLKPNLDGMKVAIDDLVALGYMKPVDLNIVRLEFIPT